MDVPSLSGAISLSQLYPHLAGDDRAAAAGATEGRSPRLANNNNNQTSVRSRAFRQCTFPERLVAQFLRLNKKKHPRASVQLNRRKCTDAVAIIITLKYLMREHKSQFKANSFSSRLLLKLLGQLNMELTFAKRFGQALIKCGVIRPADSTSADVIFEDSKRQTWQWSAWATIAEIGAVNACSAQICEGPILGDVDLCIQYPTINVEHEDFCLFFPIEHLERVSITGSQLVFAYENTSKPLHHGKWVFELLTNFEFLETLQNMMRCWKSIKELDDVLADNEQSLLVRETSSILKSRPRQAQGYNTTPTRSASTRSTHKHEEVNFWRRGSESDLCTRMGPHNHLDESQFRSYSQSRLYQHNGTTHDNPEMAAKGIRPASTSPLNDLSRGVSNTFIGCENGTGTCIIQPSITSSSSNSTRSSVASQASNIMDPQGYSQHSEIRFGQFEASATEDFIESDYPSASMDDNDGEQNWLQCSWPRQRSRKRLHLCDTDYSLSRENSFSGRSMSPPLSRPRSASTRSTESYHPRRRGYTVNSYSFVSQENGHIYEELNHFDNKDAALHGLNRSPISPEMNGKASPCFSHGTSPVLDNDPARLQFGDPIAVMRNHSWRTVAQKQQSLVIPQQHISRQASCSSFYTDEHRSINNDSRPSTAGTFPSCHSGDLSGRCIDNGPVPPPPPPRPPHLRYHSSPHYVDRKSHHHALEQDYYRLDSFSRSKSQMFPEPIDLQLNGEASHRTQEEENLARSPTPIPSQHTQQSSEELQDAYASGNENTASPSSGEHLYVTLQEVQDCNLYIV